MLPSFLGTAIGWAGNCDGGRLRDGIWQVHGGWEDWNFHDRPKRLYLTGSGKGVRLHAIRASSLLLAENFLTIILRWLSSSCIG